MANILDLFTIGFNSDGLKDFETELKKNEAELDKTEKSTKNLEKKLKDLNLEQAENTVKIDETKAALDKAKAELEKYSNSAASAKDKVKELETGLKQLEAQANVNINTNINTDAIEKAKAELDEAKQELEKYTQSSTEAKNKVKALEKELTGLDNAALKNARSIKQVSAEIDSAKNSTETFKKSVETMKGSTQGKLLELRNNFAKLTKAVGALAIVGTTIKKSLEFYEQGEQLEFLAEKTGVAVEKLQLLGNAAKKYGGTTEGTAGTIENLRSQYQDARMGNVSGGMKTAYMKYGFTLSSDPEETLQRLAKRMETMKSDTAKWDLAKNLGIDEGTTRLLIQGQAKYNEELKKASKYKLYTKEDIQRMRDYRQISGDIRMGIESIFGSIYRALLPAITAIAKVVRNVTDWLSEHEGAAKIVAATLAIAGALSVLKPILETIFALSNIKIAGIILLLGALIAGVQDFIVFMQGGDSIIGKIWSKWGYDLDELRRKFEDWGETVLRWARNLKNLLTGHLDLWEEADSKKKVFDLTPEEEKKLKKALGVGQGYINSLERGYRDASTLRKGKNLMKQANESRYNPVPKGAIAAANQTQAITNNNNNNTKTITENNNNNTKVLQHLGDKNYSYGGIGITVISDNPYEAGLEIRRQIEDIDNGRMT